jgi:hypothetical protein
MNRNELTETITRSIEELGFARIKRAALIDVFASGTDISANTHHEINSFAESNGLESKNEDGDFIVFYKAGTEPPQIPS